jgi:hypothetical protein
MVELLQRLPGGGGEQRQHTQNKFSVCGCISNLG